MATPKFNGNILAAARKLKDGRTDASAAGDDGHRYKSALLAEYQNRAIRDLLTERYAADPKGFTLNFSEYVTTSGGVTIEDGAAARPGDCFQIIDVTSADGARLFFPLDQERAARVKAGRDPLLVPSTRRPCWYPEGDSVYVLPAEPGVEQVAIRYVRSHSDIVVDGENDLLLNPNWYGEVVQRMVAMGEADAARMLNG